MEFLFSFTRQLGGAIRMIQANELTLWGSWLLWQSGECYHTHAHRETHLHTCASNSRTCQGGEHSAWRGGMGGEGSWPVLCFKTFQGSILLTPLSWVGSPDAVLPGENRPSQRKSLIKRLQENWGSNQFPLASVPSFSLCQAAFPSHTRTPYTPKPSRAPPLACPFMP